MKLDARAAAVIVVLLLATGCGGNGSSDDATSGEVTPASIAENADCTGYHDDSTEELYVKQVGTCTLRGKEMRVYSFEDNTARDNWLKVAKSFGGTYDAVDRGVLTAR